MKKRLKRVFKVSACFFSILFVLVLGFAVSADETVTDLTGTTWQWRGTGNITLSGLTSGNARNKNIDFSSNGNSYTVLQFSYLSNNGTANRTIYYGNPGNFAPVWSTSGNTTSSFHSEYQEFTISGGTDVQDTELITWITANATQVFYEPTIWDNIGTFLSSCVAWLGSVVTYITGNEVLTIFVLGIAVISFSIGVLRRILSTRG